MCFVVSKTAGWEATCCQNYCYANSFFRCLFVLPVPLMHPCYGCSVVPTKTSRNFSKSIWSYISLQGQRAFFSWYLNLKPSHDLQTQRPPSLALYLSSFPGRGGTALLRHCRPPATVGSMGGIRGARPGGACVGDPRNLSRESVQGQVLSEQGFTLFQSHVSQEVESWGSLWHVDRGQS